MKQLTTRLHFFQRCVPLRPFSKKSTDDDLLFKMPNFNAPPPSTKSNDVQQQGEPEQPPVQQKQQPQQNAKPQQSQQQSPRVERMRERQQSYVNKQQSYGQQQQQQQVEQSQAMIDFDMKIEAKFGLQTLQKINQAANTRLNRTTGMLNSDLVNKVSINLYNYNSFEAPDNTFEVKRVINQINEPKRINHQRHRHSSFGDELTLNTKATSGEDSSAKLLAVSNFYLNKDRISEPLKTHNNEIIPIENDWQDKSIIPFLQNGLDIILKNPGIFPVESINSYCRGNLGEFFTRLPQYSQINEECISPYYPPGQDQNLVRMAQQHQCRYVMSTSTISSVLSHVYYCLSNFKSPHFNNLSEAYDREPLKFMISQRKPNTVFLRKMDKQKRIYSVDGDSGFIEPSNVVLLKMGKYMEKMLTTDHQFFEDHYILDPRTNKPRKELKSVPIKKGAKGAQVSYEEDYFRYMKSGNLLLRSQIDCQGVDSKGNEVVFELKTRATSVLRYEIFNYIDYLDYEIVKYKGKHSSYEREFYDLIRGGFLKYIMQCKIGRMSGALVAYHNTQKIFGFEYITLEDMEKRVFGCPEFSDVVFKSSLSMVEKIFDYILQDQDLLPSNQVQSESTGRGGYSTTATAKDGSNKIFKIGFYANEYERYLNVMVEVFDDDMFYQERFKNVLPEYMRDPIDYYIQHKIQPQVYKYVVGVYPVLNGQFIDHSPILFEPGDTLEVKHTIQRYGKIEFNEYMKFLHEAYKCDSINLDNEYAGTWSFVV